MFGKVVKGFEEVVKKIEKLKTQNDRPIERVVVAKCGELEFRGPTAIGGAAKARAEKRGRSRSRSSVSASSSHEDEEERKERKRRKKEAKKEAKQRRKEKAGARSGVVADESDPGNPLERETEEEYDLRLEREENERKEAIRTAREAREREEARLGRVDERTGLRYKGQCNPLSLFNLSNSRSCP